MNCMFLLPYLVLEMFKKKIVQEFCNSFLQNDTLMAMEHFSTKLKGHRYNSSYKTSLYYFFQGLQLQVFLERGYHLRASFIF